MSVYRLPLPPRDTESIRLTMSGDQLGDIRMAVPRNVELIAPGALEFAVGKEEFVEGRTARGCLSAFTRLETASDHEVLAFTRQWGVIGLCDHALPGVHAGCAPQGMESVEAYRITANWFGAILRLSKEIEEGRCGKEADWEALGEGLFSRDVKPWLGSPRQSVALRFYLCHFVNYYLEFAHISTNLLPREDGYQLRLKIGGIGYWPVGSLYPVLVSQLAGALIEGGLLACGQCEQLFSWRDAGYGRLPRYDRAAYCSEWCRSESRRGQKLSYKRRRIRRRKQKEADND